MYNLGYLWNRQNLQQPICGKTPPLRCRYPLTFQAHTNYPKFIPRCQCDRYLRYV